MRKIGMRMRTGTKIGMRMKSGKRRNGTRRKRRSKLYP